MLTSSFAPLYIRLGAAGAAVLAAVRAASAQRARVAHETPMARAQRIAGARAAADAARTVARLQEASVEQVVNAARAAALRAGVVAACLAWQVSDTRGYVPRPRTGAGGRALLMAAQRCADERAVASATAAGSKRVFFPPEVIRRASELEAARRAAHDIRDQARKNERAARAALAGSEHGALVRAGRAALDLGAVMRAAAERAASALATLPRALPAQEDRRATALRRRSELIGTLRGVRAAAEAYGNLLVADARRLARRAWDVADGALATVAC